MSDDQASIENFTGTTRLFPLPNLVFFPSAVQPLHIFEPRYRQMMADALAGDRLISLILLQPGWDKDYDGRPGLHSMGCLGRIMGEQLLPDGRYNLLLRGISRVRILEEIPSNRLYREARVQLLQDEVHSEISELMSLRRDLSELILPRILNEALKSQLRDMFSGEMTLGKLCDVLGFALPLPLDVRQAMLAEIDVCRRARVMLDGFRAMLTPAGTGATHVRERRFPPEFSSN